jgi:hypothetical protein
MCVCFVFLDRYLLLIDDVWSSSTWQSIWKYFPEENKKGSRIIVTTRFQAVATTCSAHKDQDHIHLVDVLSGEEANSLFIKTFSECRGNSARQSNQTKVPDRVWQMCGGLPLAIVTMAGVVASKPLMIRDEWIAVCNSLFPEPEKCHKPEEFMRIINYCYNDLPSDLKTCCLYLSIFPKGREVSRKRLIRRWIAEGFVSEKQGLSVEDVADTCFKQLIERKMMRPVEHNSNGSVKSCRVHDMVLEYIISKAAEENFITVVGSHWSMSTSSKKVRRLTIHGSDPKRAKNVDSMNLSHVRSLTVFENLDKLHFKSFKTGIVQVLDLEGCKGFRESDANVSDICEMILLKYLSLRKTDIKNLPNNISKLKYLETLDVRETEVKQLPTTVGQLERITNILGGDKRRQRTLKLPKELKGTMKSLRILSGVEIVEGSTAASDFSYFTTLRKLAIYRIHHNEDIFKNLLSSIQYLSGYSLQTLLIVDESSEFFKTLESMSSSHLTDLRALELSGKLLYLPKWLDTLQHLVKLTLSATALCTDNFLVVRKLNSLFSLTFSISEKQDPALAAILEKNKSASRGEIVVPAGGFRNVRTQWWEWVEHRSRRSDPLSKFMEVAGTMVTRRHTVGSPDAAGFRFQMPVCPLPLSAAANIPPPPYHRSGPTHFTHSRPKSRTLGRVTRWLRRRPSARVAVFTSRLPPALKLASSSAWDWLTTGTLTSKLKLLRIFVPLLPSLTFSKNATPHLERIELRFKKLEGFHGVDELGKLQDVVLTVDGHASERTNSILDGLKQRLEGKCNLIVNKYHD